LKPQDTSPSRIAAAPSVINTTLRESKPAEIAIAFPDNATASVVFGHYDQNIARIERSLGVSAYANGNQVVIKGPREASEQARRVFEMLTTRRWASRQAKAMSRRHCRKRHVGLLFPGEEGAEGEFRRRQTRKRGARASQRGAGPHLAALRKKPVRRRSCWHRQDVACGLTRGVAARNKVWSNGWCYCVPRSKWRAPAFAQRHALKKVDPHFPSMTRSMTSWTGVWSNEVSRQA
jgi:hypothetical protein